MQSERVRHSNHRSAHRPVGKGGEREREVMPGFLVMMNGVNGGMLLHTCVDVGSTSHSISCILVMAPTSPVPVLVYLVWHSK